MPINSEAAPPLQPIVFFLAVSHSSSKSICADCKTVTAANLYDTSFTLIDNPITSNNPNAIIFVTANWNPYGIHASSFDNHQIGVWYLSELGRWAIFNEDFAPMPIGASFNIITYAGPSPSLIFEQTATTANTSGYLTFLNNSSLNGNPAAHFLVTQNVDPVGSDGIINDHAVGVWYDASVGEWTIYNEDHSPISNGASFNIFNYTNAGPFVPLVATSSNTFGDSTCSSTFANSDLVLFVTHVNSGYFTDVAAVWWDAGLNENCIFDGSGNNIPLGATFMITQPW